MFSQTVEYALRAMAHLAMNPGVPQRTAEIAEKTRVPVAYLTKVLQGLQKKGLVNLQRGIGGGVLLAKQPSEMTILDIVNSVDPIERIKTCPLQLKAHGTRLCSLHKKLDDSMSTIEASLGTTTFEELLNDTNPSKALCDETPN